MHAQSGAGVKVKDAGSSVTLKQCTVLNNALGPLDRRAGGRADIVDAPVQDVTE